MLAIFDKTVATIPKPEGLELHTAESVSALKDECLSSYFASKYPGSIEIDRRPACMICSKTDVRDPISPSVFAMKDDIFCFLRGRIENIPDRLTVYKVKKEINDQANILIDAYITQRRRDGDDGPEPKSQKTIRQFYWFSLLKGFRGNFAFVLFDARKNIMFAATDVGADTGLPFYWGTDVEGNLLLSSDVEIIKQGCDKSYGSFPKGCYIMTSMGLRSFADPHKELEVEQARDNVGNLCMMVNLEA
ncbi:unnamed protein product [Microthlaspi erraticum]|uniref:DUF3700 domain-containing protein n=1 Tax=Microthlaspi erraticum TaxID=1685480 RepID=A0A6D2HSG1_9BRAS|nr:unnamed protein product [Microthlaspi erraticum]